MNTWTIITQIAAIAVLVRVAACANHINFRRIPCAVRLAFTALATGALAILISPWAGIPISWPQAMFTVGVVIYVLADRRVSL